MGVRRIADRLFQADVGYLDRVLDFVGFHLDGSGCASDRRVEVLVAAEEIFVNIAHYAYPEGDGRVRVTCLLGDAPACIFVRFADSGVPYNPLERPDPDVHAPLEERQIGGLGIFMVKNSMDAVRYRFVRGRNVLTIQRRLQEPERKKGDAI